MEDRLRIIVVLFRLCTIVIIIFVGFMFMFLPHVSGKGKIIVLRRGR